MSDLDLFGEGAKALFFGSAGFGLKWLLGSLSSRAHDIRASLTLLEQTSRDAEISMRSAMNGAPDVGRAASVMADRTTLIMKLQRALGHRADFGEIESAFSVYALSLRWADPHFGEHPVEANVEVMRSEERSLHQRIHVVARRDFGWCLFGHERPK